MDDPKQLLDRVITYLRQQQEMYGDFELEDSIDAQGTSSARGPADRTQTEHASGSTDHTARPSPDGDPESESDALNNGSAVETDTSPSSVNTTSDSESAEQAEKMESESAENTDKMAEDAQSQSHLFSTNPEASDNIYDQVEACRSLQELEELCKQTDVLQTDLENTNLVFGVGNPDADLVLIGEAPGREEDRQGEPFVGRAGQLLNKILDAINLKREDVYIANILKHRPPENRNPLPHEIKQSLPFLIKQLDLIQPRLILCLGKVAANTMLDRNTSLKSMRGTFHSFKDRYELMVTYHPAALLRNESFKRPTWEDMKKLRKRYDELDCRPS